MFGYYWWQADDIIIASLLGHCWQADDIIIGGCFQNINNALQITIPFFFFLIPNLMIAYLYQLSPHLFPQKKKKKKKKENLSPHLDPDMSSTSTL